MPIVSPFIAGVGGRMGQSPAAGVLQPMNTITSKNDRAVITPVVVRIGQTGSTGKHVNGIDEPLTTVTSKAEHLLVSPLVASLAHGNGKAGGTWGESRAKGVDQPLGTVHAGGNNFALVSAFLESMTHSNRPTSVSEPVPTITTQSNKSSLVAANLVHLNNGTSWSSVADPMRTITSGGKHAALVYSFLIKYFGTAIGQPVNEPLHTATSKARFGLIVVTIGGEPYVIVDIGMRMLTPRELARAQGFPDSYALTGSKSSQVARIGNSVCPPIARALAAANYAAAEVGEAVA